MLMRHCSELERRAKLSRRAEALLAAAGQDGPACRWYALTVAPGADISVDKALDQAAIEHWMAATEVNSNWRGGHRRRKRGPMLKPSLPGYIFVRVAWSDGAWHALSTIDGVDGIIGGAERPVPLPDKEVGDFRKRADGDPEFIETLVNGLKLGDSVMIDAGPFALFPGIVTALMGDNGRVEVEVGLFGRAVPVSLDVAQLSKSD
jgi:transcriptional antiterminator NusG